LKSAYDDPHSALWVGARLDANVLEVAGGVDQLDGTARGFGVERAAGLDDDETLERLRVRSLEANLAHDPRPLGGGGGREKPAGDDKKNGDVHQ
jgi:hypothetical protein